MSQSTWKEYNGKDPIWCAGCGDFGVLRAMQKAAAELELARHETVLVTGIGCSGNITAYFRSYGYHGIHGRSLPVAAGVKLANRDLNVLVAGGDGDGFGIGLGHFMHAARRNVNVTYIVMDNQVYGLTKGQTSPTTDPGMTTKASPLGPLAQPVNPLELAMAAGASFVAQGFSGDQKGLIDLIKQGVNHPGFALINIQSPCVTYNHLNTLGWFKDNMQHVTHDPSNRQAALDAAHDRSHVPIGLLWKEIRPTLDSLMGEGDMVGAAADPAGSLQDNAQHVAAWVDAFRIR